MPAPAVFSQEGSGYQFVRRLAEGGMGTVDLVVKRGGRFRRVYAMKRLKSAYAEETELRTMFLDEGHLCGLLRHPNIVSVIDVGEDRDGPYMVMEYIDGVTCQHVARDAHRRGALVPEQVVLRIMAQAARGLHAAHELRDPSTGSLLNVVHRDVSPQNIIIGFDGLARLSDFGVARSKGRATHTRSGVLKGKISYTAPEVLRFRPPTLKADLFALGVVTWEMLAARRMFRGDMREVAVRITEEPVPDIDEVRTDIHPAVVELLFRLLAKDPNARPESAAEVVAKLEAVIAERAETEGTLAIDRYLEEHFPQTRQENEALMSLALRSSTFSLDEAETPSLEEGITEEMPTVVAEPPRRRRGRMWALAAVGAAAGALALWATEGAPADETAPAVERPEPAPTPSGSAELPAAAPVPIEPAVEPSAAEAPPLATEEAAAEPEESPRPTGRRRTRRTTMTGAPMTAAAMAAAPMTADSEPTAPPSPFSRNPYDGR